MLIKINFARLVHVVFPPHVVLQDSLILEGHAAVCACGQLVFWCRLMLVSDMSSDTCGMVRLLAVFTLNLV